MDASNTAQVSSFNIKSLLNKILFHWPLFVISFPICFGIAAYYLRYKRPVYQIYAKVMIKDPQQDAGKAALEAINLGESQTNIDGQVGLMSSIPVTKQVVEDLQLWVTYLQPTEYHSYRDIYTNSPVQFKLLKPGKMPLYATIDIIIESDSTFLIKKSDDKTQRIFFDKSVVNSFGTWRLDKKSNFKDYLGQTLQIRLNEIDNVVSFYQYSIHKMPNTKSSSIELRLEDEVPERGREILDDLLRVYMAASVEEKRKSSQNTLKFVDQRLESITEELNNVESKYEGYKSNRGITEIADQSSQYVGSVQSNDKQINDIKIKISVIDGIERYLNSPEGRGSMPSTIGVEDGALQGLMDKLTELQLERTRMLSTLPETNPLFNPINQQITATRASLRENLKTTRSTLVETQRHLQNVGSNYQSTIRSIPGQERDLSDIKRMQGIKENLYIYLLQKKEELSLDYASTISDAVVIDDANNGSQSAPIPRSVYSIAFLLGLMLPTGLIYGREALKSRVISKNAIIGATGLPVLSEITDADNNGEPIVVLNQKSYIGEQFRDLRTKLSYLHSNNQTGKTTLFTSSIAGEGKSFVLVNLATVLAVAGKKTLIIELDLRRPTFSTRFKLKYPDTGLTDYIIGNATQHQIVQTSGVSDNLHVICGGSIPPNPSELLESTQLANLIEEFKSQYDHILIDTPPVHLVTDATIVAHMCDVCFYVIRQDYTPNQELEYIRELHMDKKLPRLNLIFNAVKTDSSVNSYIYQKNGYIKEPSKSFKGKLKTFLSRF
jgi:tyrosine-protein kinase Etk/Wzc